MTSDDDTKFIDMRPAYELVGEFMWAWAFLERRLNKGVEKLLRLRGIEATVAVANMQVRDKIHVIRTIAHLYCSNQTDWMASTNKLLDVVSARNTDRNVVAHNLFFRHKRGGVEFHVVKAKGRFQLPDTIWSLADFEHKRDNMNALGKGLDIACEYVDSARRRLDQARIPVNSLASLFLPNEDTRQLMGLLGLGNQAPAAQGSPEPNPAPAPRKRRAPRPKPEG